MKLVECNRYLLLIMKFTCLHLILLIIFSTALYAKNTEGQTIFKKSVQINVSGETIREILTNVGQESGVSFIYSSPAIAASRKITYKGKIHNLKQFASEFLSPLHINYRIVENKIILSPDKYIGTASTDEKNMSVSIPNSSLSIVSNNITGSVKNDKGEPLSSTTVKILNTNFVTVSDSSGNYQFADIPAGSYDISFSHIGYITKIEKVTVNGNVISNIILSEDVLSLGDVIITSSGGQHKKIESSVAITTISNKDILLRAPLNGTDLLKAIPGLQVESSGGDGPGKVWVRGFPQQGGYIYIGIMEDGLPLLPTGFNSVPTSIDQYYKTDVTIKNVEAIRRGDASLLLPSTPGALVNNISYTGATKTYGQIKYTEGFSQNQHRIDGNVGGQISNNVQYNIGGFYRTDKGIIPPPYTSNKGGQLKGNLTFFFDDHKGYIRVYGKYLNDINQWMLPSFYSYDGTGKPTKYGSYDMFTQSIVPVDKTWQYTDANNTVHNYNLSDGIHTKLGSGQVEFNYNTNNNWTINNNFRYQYANRSVTAIIPIGISPYDETTPYYYLGGGPANLQSGGQYPSQIVTDIALAYRGHDMQVVDYINLKKKINNNQISFGGGIFQYNVKDEPEDQFIFQQEFKENPRRLLTTNSGDGISHAATLNNIGNTRILSAYVADELSLGRQWRINAGIRSNSASDLESGFTKYNETVNNWAASLGINYSINSSLALFARGTRAYNAPTVQDYTTVPYVDTLIKKRPIYLGEAGVKYAKDKWSLFASASYSAIKNVTLSIAVPAGDAGLQSLLAFGSTRTWSGEYEISYAAAKPLVLRLTGTLQNSKYTSYEANTQNSAPAVIEMYGDTTFSFTGKKTERVPAINTELSATYTYKNLNVYVAGSYMGGRYTSPSDSYELPAYFFMHANVGYSFGKHFELRFWVDNLLNTRALTEGDVRGDQFRNYSEVPKGTLLPGRAILPRSFWGSFSYTF